MEKRSTNAEIRRLTRDDLEQSMRLAEYAFQYERTDEQRQEDIGRAVPEWRWGAFVDGRLAAQLIQYPLTVYMQGRKMGMGGIGAVSSWPEMRRGGLVARLLVQSLRAMKEEGQAVSMLTPFSYAFYRKYGWEMAIDRKKYTVPTHLWPVSAGERIPGGFDRLPKDAGAIIERIGPVYEQFAARYNGMLSRTGDWWTNHVIRRRGGEIAVYRDASGRDLGYLHYQVKNREVTVHEFVALTPEAERALWQFIALHDSMAERAVLHVPVDDPLSLLGAEPRFQQEIVPYFMGRIVDVEAFLAQYRFASLEERPHRWAERKDASFVLDVEDAHAEWNNGRFAVTVDEAGRAEAVRTDEGGGRPVIRGSIQAFSALFFGYRRAADLRRYGKLEADDEAAGLLDAVAGAGTPFLCDFF